MELNVSTSFRYHNTSLENITATLLLPVVPVVVASASGGVVAEVLPNQGHAAMTVSASYILWGLGQTFSFFALATYFLRLQVHDLPPREAIVSVFLPIGPFGQGGFAILQLGRVALGVFSDRPTDGTMVGTVFYAIGLLTALLMSGAALGWLSFALISILTAKGFPFNMGWWGFTFPLGVCATCTGLLAKELSSPFFKAVTMVNSSGTRYALAGADGSSRCSPYPCCCSGWLWLRRQSSSSSPETCSSRPARES